MRTYLDIVKKVDVVPYSHEAEYDDFVSHFFRLKSHDGSFNLGYLIPSVVKELFKYPQYFMINDNIVKFSFSLDTIEKREEALEIIGNEWKNQGLFDTLKGWRNEKYTIYGPINEVYFHLERAMCPLFGVVMYGVHINGYVKSPITGEIKLWVPRRAANKATYPGMLDNTVAGGLGYPYGPIETCYKECYEEAGLEERYVTKNIKSCGVISYLYQLKPFDFESELGSVQPEVEYIYDLYMDENTIPHPVDHESEDFQLMTIDEVKKRLLNGEFKDNCGAIIVDFLIRHSIITPELEKDYIQINSKLHRYLPFPVRSN